MIEPDSPLIHPAPIEPPESLAGLDVREIEPLAPIAPRVRPRTHVTHTVAVLGLSQSAYDEIAGKLRAASYDHCFGEDGLIDLSGVGVLPE